MRRQTVQLDLERAIPFGVVTRPAAHAADLLRAPLVWGLGAGLLGLTILVSLAILTASGRASAEPAVPPVPQIASAPAAIAAVGAVPQPAFTSLDTLLAIPGLSAFRSDAQVADESIAAAVERGTNPDLEKLSAFRKRSNDLFRAERPVEIGEQEMLLRLRLRAKARRAMSVELRF